VPAPFKVKKKAISLVAPNYNGARLVYPETAPIKVPLLETLQAPKDQGYSLKPIMDYVAGTFS